MGGYQAKHNKLKIGYYADLNPCPLHWYVPRFNHPSLPGTGREIPLLREVSLINVNVS